VGPPAVRRPRHADDLIFRPAATAQLELAGTLALNTGTVILTTASRSASKTGKTPMPIHIV